MKVDDVRFKFIISFVKNIELLKLESKWLYNANSNNVSIMRGYHIHKTTCYDRIMQERRDNSVFIDLSCFLFNTCDS